MSRRNASSDNSEGFWGHDHTGEVEIPDDDYSLSSGGSSEKGFSGFNFRKFWAFTGPGWLMSIAYLDPGNIESDLQQGISGGFKLGWVLLWSTALGLVLQIFAARVGVVTGRHLAEICRERYRRGVRIALWLCTELAIVGSDIQEVVGSAIALNILFGLPLWVGVLLTGFDAFTFLLLEHLGVRKLEAFFAALIFTMAVTFFIVFGIGAPNMAELGKGLVIPDIPRRAVMQAVGTVGAVIMPHNVYLHSALVQSRKIRRGRKAKVDEANYYFSIEAGVSLFVSLLINLAIVSVFAQNFYFTDPDHMCLQNPPTKCSDIGLKEAGDVLAVSFGGSGRAAQIIWAIGLLAAGQSSTMTGTYAGQFVMNGFLNLNLKPWMRTLMTRCIAVVPAVVIAVLAKNQFDQLDEWLNVLQSLVLPFALLPLLQVVASEDLMGPYRTGRYMQAFGWFAVAGIIGINIYLTIQTVGQMMSWTWYIGLAAAIFGIVYIGFCAYLVWFKLTRDNRVAVHNAELKHNAEALLTEGLLESDGNQQAVDTPEDVMEVPWWRAADAININ